MEVVETGPFHWMLRWKLLRRVFSLDAEVEVVETGLFTGC